MQIHAKNISVQATAKTSSGLFGISLIAALAGIDLGGTKIECAVLNKDMSVIIRKCIPTEADKGYKHILNQVLKLMYDVAEEINERPEYAGVATPGILEHETQTMKNCNTVCMNGNGKLTTPICKPLLGDSAGVYGAALLWQKSLAHTASMKN